MHARFVTHAARIGSLLGCGLVGVLLLTGESNQIPATSLSVEAATDNTGAAIDTAAPAPTVRALTLHDSLRAEEALPPSALRRPLERYLAQYSADRVLVRRISRAVLRESRRQRVPPSLIAAVLLTENTTLRPAAESAVGAQGLMQVMPFHAGARLCQSDDLVDVDSNICHGTLILARSLQTTGSSVAALLRYNGCVRGTNTPDCHRYPSLVLARAGRVRHAMLADTNTLAAMAREPALMVALAER